MASLDAVSTAVKIGGIRTLYNLRFTQLIRHIKIKNMETAFDIEKHPVMKFEKLVCRFPLIPTVDNINRNFS